MTDKFWAIFDSGSVFHSKVKGAAEYFASRYFPSSPLSEEQIREKAEWYAECLPDDTEFEGWYNTAIKAFVAGAALTSHKPVNKNI